MTATPKTAPKLYPPQHAVGRFQRAGRLPICVVLVYGLLVCAGVPSADVPAAENGTINGTVLDEHANPVPRTNVFALITNRAGPALVPWAETDANGHFAINHLRWGTYVVVADRPGSPFGETIPFTNFYRRHRVPWITVSPQSPVAKVALRLLPKFASLSGRIVSVRTGKPVTQASIELRRPGHEGASAGHAAPARFTLPIPSEMIIALTVHARGFEPWHLSMKMAPGERKVLTIRLMPLASTPRAPSARSE